MLPLATAWLAHSSWLQTWTVASAWGTLPEQTSTRLSPLLPRPKLPWPRPAPHAPLQRGLCAQSPWQRRHGERRLFKNLRRPPLRAAGTPQWPRP